MNVQQLGTSNRSASLRLFAAVDGHGAVRFPGDVPRGAACACFCSICGSPLVSKQGTVNVWHFAHEAGQERPECPVGAANLFRRLVAELLISGEWSPSLPHYERLVQVATRFGTEAELVAVQIQSKGHFRPSEPVELTGAADLVASIALSSGTQVDICVELDGLPPHSATFQGTGRALLVLKVPPLPALSTTAEAIAFVKGRAAFEWLHLPEGLIAERAAEKRCAELLYKAQQDWEARQTSMRAAPALVHSIPPRSAKPSSDAPSDWPPRYRPKTSATAWRFDDGSGLLLYRLAVGTAMGLARLPNRPLLNEAAIRVTGWADPKAEFMEIADWQSLIPRLNQIPASILSSSDLAELSAFLGL